MPVDIWFEEPQNIIGKSFAMSLMVSSVPHAPNSLELEHSARGEGHFFFTTEHVTCVGEMCHIWTMDVVEGWPVFDEKFAAV